MEAKLINETDIDKIIAELNGSSEAGIISSTGAVYDPTSALPEKIPRKLLPAWTLLLCHNKEITDTRLRSYLLAAAHLTLKRQLFDKYCNVNRDQTVMDAKYLEDQMTKFNLSVDNMPKFTKDEAGTAMNIVACCKINWWMTNHHTGQGALTGYSLKVYKSRFPDVNEKQYTTAAWIMGHWVATAGMLDAMGLPKVKVETAFDWKVIPSDDARMRLNSNPAGTAKGSFVMAVLAKISTSSYKGVVPWHPATANVVNQMADVAINRCEYHRGAEVLGYKCKYLDIDDDLTDCCSAFINAAAPKHTLTKSNHCKTRDMISDHSWFVNINKLKVDIARAVVYDEAYIAKMMESNKASSETTDKYIELTYVANKIATAFADPSKLEDFNYSPDAQKEDDHSE